MMNLNTVLVVLLLLPGPIHAREQVRDKTRPNVVFVFSDDQRFDALAMTGGPITQTPHLDQLAKDGVFFNQAYITSPICGPSRANLFTGQWERKNRVGFTNMSDNVVTAEAFENCFLMQLKKAGYSTAFIGKHHTKIVDSKNSPLKKNMDFCYFKEGHLGFHPGEKGGFFSNLKNKSQVEGLFEATAAYLKPGSDYDYFYDNADASMKSSLKRRDPAKPFVAWINFNLPHQASLGGMGSKPEDPEFYSTLYEGMKDRLPLPDGYPQTLGLPSEVLNVDEMESYYRLNQARLLDTKLKTERANYAIDRFIGNLRELLKELKEDRNTIIVFCSDNGLLYGEHGISGKTMLYEESAHVPLIIYSPHLAKEQIGRRLESLVVGQDIPATILDMCGLQIPSTYQGRSMLPLLNGEPVDWRNDIFLENLFTDQGYPRQEAVRSGEWKYIRYYSKEKDRKQYLPEGIPGEKPIFEELFNMREDPKEQRNLANNPEYAAVLEASRIRCQQLAVELSE